MGAQTQKSTPSQLRVESGHGKSRPDHLGSRLMRRRRAHDCGIKYVHRLSRLSDVIHCPRFRVFCFLFSLFIYFYLLKYAPCNRQPRIYLFLYYLFLIYFILVSHLKTMQRTVLLLLGLSFLLLAVSSFVEERVTFHDHQVLRFSIRNETERDQVLAVVKKHRLDLWAATPEWIDVRVSPDERQHLQGLLVPYRRMIRNLQALLDQEAQHIQVWIFLPCWKF